VEGLKKYCLLVKPKGALLARAVYHTVLRHRGALCGLRVQGSGQRGSGHIVPELHLNPKSMTSDMLGLGFRYHMRTERGPCEGLGLGFRVSGFCTNVDSFAVSRNDKHDKVHQWSHTHTHEHTHTYTYTHSTPKHTHMHTHACIHAYTRLNTHTHMHTHTCTHTHAYTRCYARARAHTHTHTGKAWYEVMGQEGDSYLDWFNKVLNPKPKTENP
jgi:hypothetical protein